MSSSANSSSSSSSVSASSSSSASIAVSSSQQLQQQQQSSRGSHTQFPLLIDPIPVTRIDYRTPDGHIISQIRDETKGTGYQFVKKLCDALMGKVKLAVKCVRHPLKPGEWIVQQPYQYVAIKQLDKYCVARGITTKGHRVQENPLQEVGVLLHLSGLGLPSSSATNGTKGASSTSLSSTSSSSSSYPRIGGHPNVLNIYDLCEDNDRVYIVLEYLAGGELFYALEAHLINEEKARTYFTQLVEGLRYCHLSGVAHRDVSLENTLLSTAITSGTSEAKLIDFGLAVRIPDSLLQFHSTKTLIPSSSKSSLSSPPSQLLLPSDGRIGKERYMAPEIFTLQMYDPIAVDTWELGVSLFLLLFGVYPYKLAHKDACPYFKAIADGQLVPLLKEWGFHNIVSYEAIDLVNLLLQTSPGHRLPLEKILQHPWLTGNHSSRNKNSSSSSVKNEPMGNTTTNGKNDMMVDETMSSTDTMNTSHTSYPHHSSNRNFTTTNTTNTTTTINHNHQHHTVTTMTTSQSSTTMVTDEMMDE